MGFQTTQAEQSTHVGRLSSLRASGWLRGSGTAALALLVGVTGCAGGSADQPADRSEVTAQIASEVIVPGYEDLAADTAELAERTEELCAAPDQAALESARQAWDAAMGAWMWASAFGFGPVRSLRTDAKIAYPADVAKVEELAGDEGTVALDEASVGGLGADARGLNAVQYLLFSPADVEQLTPRACTYAAVASALVSAGATEVLEAWTDGSDGEPPMLQQFSSPGPDSMWSSPTEALEDVLNSMLGTLTAVIDRGLGPASGETTAEPEPQVVDEAPAHRALQDMADQLGGVAAVYGDSTDEPPTGVSWLVTSSSEHNSDAAIRSDLADAMDEIGLVPPPLFDLDPAEADSPAMESLISASQHAMAVRSALSTEVASLLGLTVGFSDSDGDA